MDTLKQMYASQARAIVAIRDSAITEALKDRGGVVTDITPGVLSYCKMVQYPYDKSCLFSYRGIPLVVFSHPVFSQIQDELTASMDYLKLYLKEN